MNFTSLIVLIFTAILAIGLVSKGLTLYAALTPETWCSFWQSSSSFLNKVILELSFWVLQEIQEGDSRNFDSNKLYTVCFYKSEKSTRWSFKISWQIWSCFILVLVIHRQVPLLDANVSAISSNLSQANLKIIHVIHSQCISAIFIQTPLYLLHTIITVTP